MARIVDLTLINARQRDLEQVIQEGKYIEKLEAEGRDPEEIKEAAKKALGLNNDDLIILEYQAKITQMNLETKAFVALVNFRVKAEETNLLTNDEMNQIRDIEARLANKTVEKYNIELEDLYTEGENDE